LKIQKKFVDYNKVGKLLNDRFQTTGFENFEELHGFLTLAINQETTIKNIRSKSSYKKPWETRELREMCRKKRKFSKLRYDYPENNYFREKLLELKLLVKTSVNSANFFFYSQLYGKNLNNPKEIWKITNEILMNQKKVATRK
jgi:hypothetical protein